MSRSDHSNHERALIIFPGALGDLICLVPAIRRIAARNPGTSLELMARSELARFAVGRLGITRAHSIDRREVGHLFAASSDVSADAREFFGEFDAIYSFFAADYERFRHSLLAIAPGRVNFYPFRPPGHGHVSACYLRAIGEENREPLQSRIDLLPDDLERASHRLADLGLKSGQILLILPGSGSPSKNWPADRFAELAERLALQLSSLVVLGPAEERLERLFLRRGLACLSCLDLGELAGLARLTRGFIGNDSGVSHLAAAAGGCGITIFGATDPLRWRPLGNISVIRRQPIENLTVEELAGLVRSCIV
jgi:heptosyltransferase-2